MIKALLITSVLVGSIFIAPATTIALLGIWSIYVLYKTTDYDYPSTAQYGIMSFRSEPKAYSPRPKDYHDYQIESYISNLRSQRAYAIENTGLTWDEEKAIEDLETRLKNS